MAAKRQVIRALTAVRDALDSTYKLSEEIQRLLIEQNETFTEFRKNVIQEINDLGAENKAIKERLRELDETTETGKRY